MPTPLADCLVRLAVAEIGHGQTPTDRAVYLAATGNPRSTGAWCAAFASWAIKEACWRCGVPCPPLSRGAKALVRKVGTRGAYLATPEPGAIIAWHRRSNAIVDWLHDWRGHVGVVESYDAATDTCVCVEGNRVRDRVSQVCRCRHSESTWRRRLYRIARLPSA